MTPSRLLALLATLVLALAGCGGDDGDGAESKDARVLLQSAFEKQVDSADLRLDFKADLEGLDQVKGPISLSIEGPFKSNGPEQLPHLDWDVKMSGLGPQNIDAGLIVTRDNAYVAFQGQSYEVGEQLFGQVKRSFAQQQKQSGSQPSLKRFGINPVEWLDDPKVEDGEDVGGDATRKVSGNVDVKQVVTDVLEALRSPALRSQLESQGQTVPQIPEVGDDTIDKVADAIDEFRFEVNVDGDDIARRVFAEAEFDVPEDADAGSLKGGKVSFSYVLEDVGIDPDIKAPSSAQPLGLLLRQFGLGGGQALPLQQ